MDNIVRNTLIRLVSVAVVLMIAFGMSALLNISPAEAAAWFALGSCSTVMADKIIDSLK